MTLKQHTIRGTTIEEACAYERLNNKKEETKMNKEEKIMEMLSNRSLLNGIDTDIIGEIREELRSILQ